MGVLRHALPFQCPMITDAVGAPLAEPPTQMSRGDRALAESTWTRNDACRHALPLKCAMYPACALPAGAPNAQALVGVLEVADAAAVVWSRLVRSGDLDAQA